MQLTKREREAMQLFNKYGSQRLPAAAFDVIWRTAVSRNNNLRILNRKGAVVVYHQDEDYISNTTLIESCFNILEKQTVLQAKLEVGR